MGLRIAKQTESISELQSTIGGRDLEIRSLREENIQTKSDCRRAEDKADLLSKQLNSAEVTLSELRASKKDNEVKLSIVVCN